MRELVERLQREGAEAFEASWQWPSLVKKPDHREVVQGEAHSFHTEARSVAAAEEALRRARSRGLTGVGSTGEQDDDDDALRVDDVLALTKRAGSTTFADRIGVGRAANMDVVIALPRVSKYHAYVTYADGELLICDARSTFGTFVDGLKLEPMIATPVQSGAQVELGPYSFRIYSPEGLRGFMEAIVRTRGSTPPNE